MNQLPNSIALQGRLFIAQYEDGRVLRVRARSLQAALDRAAKAGTVVKILPA